MRCFMVPRGSTVLVGGDATAGATKLRRSAELGSSSYGVLSNRYLDEHGRTVRYELTVRTDGDCWSYEEDTVLAFSGLPEPFHHTDRNTLQRV